VNVLQGGEASWRFPNLPVLLFDCSIGKKSLPFFLLYGSAPVKIKAALAG